VVFIIVLCAAYSWRDWRRVLILLTGFTLGHSITLALTALHVISFPTRLIETLIPLTILASSLLHLLWPRPQQIGRHFAVATLFGFIHGCGFAGYFGMMLGDEASIVGPLFAFNVGLEIGQIVVVLFFYAWYYMIEKFRPFHLRDWTLFVSGAGAGLALKMLLDLWAK
jgi:hypothetical protein